MNNMILSHVVLEFLLKKNSLSEFSMCFFRKRAIFFCFPTFGIWEVPGGDSMVGCQLLGILPRCCCFGLEGSDGDVVADIQKGAKMLDECVVGHISFESCHQIHVTLSK